MLQLSHARVSVESSILAEFEPLLAELQLSHARVSVESRRSWTTTRRSCSFN